MADVFGTIRSMATIDYISNESTLCGGRRNEMLLYGESKLQMLRIQKIHQIPCPMSREPNDLDKGMNTAFT